MRERRTFSFGEMFLIPSLTSAEMNRVAPLRQAVSLLKEITVGQYAS